MIKSLITKISIGTATALAASLIAIPAAADTISVIGNGAGSHNNVTVENTTATGIDQTNTAFVSNDVSVNNSTGSNSANGNTGGDVSVTSGDATGRVSITNTVNTNDATLNSCGCATPDTSVTVSGNGSGSHNKVKVTNSNLSGISQDNLAFVSNNVRIRNKTGKNKTNHNTGGDMAVLSGPATSSVGVSNNINHNTATINPGP